jgi:tetratricopeptide (TPR) repeat protein
MCLVTDYFSIIEEGARLNPRNAIICQTLLRNAEPSRSMQLLKEWRSKWTSEFGDKMTTAVCETLAQKGLITHMRKLFAETAATCSSKQRYKLLFTSSILELVHGDASLAPLLLDLAVRATPFKSKPFVLIFWAKVYELNGEYDQALATFDRITRDYSAEWRAFLELAQFYVHRNDVRKAIEVLTTALQKHSGSGRLWAFRVQLEAFVGVEAQINELRRAIQAVPKSGEVWCEAARIALNPLTEYFSLASAKKYLEFAYRFTPQHGDSLIEMLRIEVLEKGFNGDFSEIKKKFMGSEGNYGLLFIFVRGLDERPLLRIFEDAVKEVQADVARNSKVYARAIARSSFVVRSVTQEEEKVKQMRAVESPASFAFGLTNVGKMMLNPSLCVDKKQKLSIVLGSSGCGQ